MGGPPASSSTPSANRAPTRSMAMSTSSSATKCWTRTTSSPMRLASGIGEEVVRVQHLVAEELVDIAMERVGARFADGVDDDAGGPPILGRVVTGDELQLVHQMHW